MENENWANIRIFNTGRIGEGEWEWECLINGKVVCQGRLIGSEAQVRNKAEAALTQKINKMKDEK